MNVVTMMRNIRATGGSKQALYQRLIANRLRRNRNNEAKNRAATIDVGCHNHAGDAIRSGVQLDQVFVPCATNNPGNVPNSRPGADKVARFSA